MVKKTLKKLQNDDFYRNFHKFKILSKLAKNRQNG